MARPKTSYTLRQIAEATSIPYQTLLKARNGPGVEIPGEEGEGRSRRYTKESRAAFQKLAGGTAKRGRPRKDESAAPSAAKRTRIPRVHPVGSEDLESRLAAVEARLAMLAERIVEALEIFAGEE
jgi:hypothetical protein